MTTSADPSPQRRQTILPSAYVFLGRKPVLDKDQAALTPAG
jgi:hypothetical protein